MFFTDAEYACKRKQARRERFLIEPHYPESCAMPITWVGTSVLSIRIAR
jgi:hypothetical protein